MKSKVRTHVAAAIMLLAPAAALVGLPEAAIAKAAAPAPEIFTMAVNSDEGVQRGADLNFAVEGTPRSKVTVTFSGITTALKETSAGMYRGTYTVRAKDKINVGQPIVAKLTSGTRTNTHSFTWPSSFQAAAMGAAPAIAPNPAGAPVVARIENFRMSQGRIEPGRELHFAVMGAPGSTATVDIPGVVSGVQLREVSPGRYEGTYTVRQRDNPDAFANAQATLRNGPAVVTARASMPRERDNQPPTVVSLSPSPGEVVSSRGLATVSGTFDDQNGRGVDPASVRIVLSGRDITPQSRITSREFTFREDLPPGRYTAEVSARDYAGNAVTKSWNFEVRPDRMGALPPTVLPPTSALPPLAAPGGPLPLVLSTPNNAVVDSNGNLQITGRTAPFARVHVRVDAVPPVVGALLGVAQRVAEDTVQADRDGYFSMNVASRNSQLPGTRYEVSVSANSNSQTAEQRITLYQRQG